MTILTVTESDMELPDTECSDCGVVFNICWARNPLYTKIEYCPFCGDEVEGIKQS